MSVSSRDEPTSLPAVGADVVWPLFVRASLSLAATAGFSLGAALFAVSARGQEIGPWWPAAAQAHGHIQVFGFGGLMVLGVGLHFLPRLRGSSLLHPGRVRLGAYLLIAGLVTRGISQPALALVVGADAQSAALGACLVGSGMLELAGTTLVLLQLAGAARRGPRLQTRAHLWPVLPFFLVAFAAYWLALGVNLAGLVAADRSSSGLVPGRFDDLSTQLAFYGFLVPISVAMAERTFPIFFQTPRPRLVVLRTGLVVLLAGLGLRGGAEFAGRARSTGWGELATAVAICLFIVGLGVFAPRRSLPRQPVRPLRDPIQLHAITAYVWLILTAVLLLQSALALLGMAIVPVSQDAERHALGAGFVTILILGLGAQLLPGFANRRRRSDALVWVTLVLGNGAALLRVGPLLVSGLSPALTGAISAVSGMTALAALIVFAVNVPTSIHR
jgi:uncharacterized protein involved in response to NO